MDRFVDKFNEVMSHRLVAIVVMLATACGGILTVAGGYYTTYRIITLLSN